MIDGMRYPPQDQGLCQIEPDIIPVAAIERIDLLLDGASATYGSDAIGGVFNIILRRNFDGAVTQLGYKRGAGGNNRYFASQLWGRTWDGGSIVLSYEWRDTAPTKGRSTRDTASTSRPSAWTIAPRSRPRCRAPSQPAQRLRTIRRTIRPLTVTTILRLLRHSGRHRQSVQPDQRRRRSDRALQCVDAKLASLQYELRLPQPRLGLGCGGLGGYPKRVQPLLDCRLQR